MLDQLKVVRQRKPKLRNKDEAETASELSLGGHFRSMRLMDCEKCGQRLAEKLGKGIANRLKNYRRVTVLNVKSTADWSTKINWLF